MKYKVLYGLVVLLFFSVVQFNLSNTFAGKIDYKKIYKNECQKCHERDGKGTKRGKKLGVPNFTDAKWQCDACGFIYEPENLKKAELVFPSGESLPQCWTDPHYRDD